jgi:hypothetical protein
MYFNDLVRYLYFDAQPHNLYDFLRCVVKKTCQCIYFYQRTTKKGNKVHNMTYKFTGRTVGGASREPQTHRTIFYFLFLHLNFTQF